MTGHHLRLEEPTSEALAEEDRHQLARARLMLS